MKTRFDYSNVSTTIDPFWDISLDLGPPDAEGKYLGKYYGCFYFGFHVYFVLKVNTGFMLFTSNNSYSVLSTGFANGMERFEEPTSLENCLKRSDFHQPFSHLHSQYRGLCLLSKI